MKLYDAAWAPNPRKVRVYLAEKGIDVPRVAIDMRAAEHLQPDYLAINPRGLLPTLQLDDGEVIDDSVAICRYLEALNPAPSLFGQTPLAIARIDRWTRYVEQDGYAAAVYALRNAAPAFADRAVAGAWPPMPQLPGLVDRARAMWAVFLDRLDARLGDSEWIAGADYSFADITALVTIDFAKAANLAVDDAHANVLRWHAAASARPSAAA